MLVLLIEDEESSAELVRAVVQDADVRWVRTLAEARAHLQDTDVVLLDLQLPDSEGFGSIASLLDAAPHLPLVILTSNPDPALMLQALEAGAQEYVHKDDLVQLAQRLRAAAIRQRHRNRALSQALRSGMSNAERFRDVLTPVAPRSLEAFGRQPLSTALPEVFRQWTEEYAELIGGYVTAQTYSSRERPLERTKSLARDIALVNAAPRDLIDVHLRALDQLSEDDQPERATQLAEEAKMVLIEVLGYLALQYRDNAPFRSPQLRPS